MKKLLAVIGLTALLVSVSQAQTPLEMLSKFFGNAPTNTWELKTYVAYDDSPAPEKIAYGLGGGARLSYLVASGLQTCLDLNWCEGGWTFGTFSVELRGGVNIGSIAKLSPYAFAGPGWSFQSWAGDKSLVAVAGAGADIDIPAVKWLKLFAEYQKRTTNPETTLLIAGVRIPLD